VSSNNMMFDASHDPRQNRLLAALPHDQWERWRSQLEYVDMPLGQVLYEPGGTLSHVYFPTTAIVSLLYVMQNGESAEIAVVGNDGLVGVFLFMGGDFTSSRALVQSAGGAYRLTAQLMTELRQDWRLSRRARRLASRRFRSSGSPRTIRGAPRRRLIIFVPPV
jgi:hypothetical protein